ncbi:glycoside hydrolase family 5 protein [Maribacter sp. 2308TA10-17]|uniref:glycoside hydrolase family 5 protein n=1 Tax=Maribacter sp. 2308TA10-17 TaxID=3386276 RepID=UPI0039BCF4F3
MKKNCIRLVLICLLFSTTSCNSSSDEPIVSDEIAEDQTPMDDPVDITQTSSSSFVADHGQLRIEGTKIVDKDGEVVQLRGMSFFWSQWAGEYYTSQTVKWLKEDWQCNVVRAAMGVDEGGDAYIANPEREKQKIFTIIDAAIAEGIYVIVDWHSHHAEDYVADAKSFFDEVSKKYGDTPNIIYETYNEPLDVSWSGTLKAYHEDVLATIRANDPDNIVICGTRTWSQRVDEVIGNKIDDANVAYTLHYYSATHKQELRDIAQQAIDNNIPIFVTEYGVSEASGDGSIDIAESNAWWDFLDTNDIGWCNWSIVDKEELSAALKPGASTSGNWPMNQLTESGTMVRAEIKAKNPNYSD